MSRKSGSRGARAAARADSLSAQHVVGELKKTGAELMSGPMVDQENSLWKVLEDGLEEVGLAPAEPGKRHGRVADEWPQDPAHLAADQGKDDDPEPKHRFDVLAQDAVLERIERTAGSAAGPAPALALEAEALR